MPPTTWVPGPPHRRWRQCPGLRTSSPSVCCRTLQFTASIGRAPNTVDAYGRALQDYLAFCESSDADPVTAKADVIAAWIGDMRTRADDDGNARGLSDATVQQRVVAVRAFYDTAGGRASPKEGFCGTLGWARSSSAGGTVDHPARTTCASSAQLLSGFHDPGEILGFE